MLVFMEDAAKASASADVVDEPVRFGDWLGRGVGSGACEGAVGAVLVVATRKSHVVSELVISGGAITNAALYWC
jgi:hypothetical protein